MGGCKARQGKTRQFEDARALHGSEIECSSRLQLALGRLKSGMIRVVAVVLGAVDRRLTLRGF